MSPVVLLTAFLLGFASVQPYKAVVIRQQIRLEVGESSCVIKALEAHSALRSLDEIASVQCDGKIVLRQELKDAEIFNILVLGHADHGRSRVAVSWERGLVAGLTVIEVQSSQLKTSASVVFEHSSKCGAEVLNDGDLLLANVGQRFVNAEALPSGTNVYRWKDGRYLFEAGFRWKDDANWNDRYCILYKPESCPATMTTKPILESS